MCTPLRPEYAYRLAMSSTSALSTGFPGLDQALQGVWRGDNVVWELHGDASPAPLYSALARAASSAELPIVHVTVGGGTRGLRESLPAGIARIDACATSVAGRPGPGPLAVARAVEHAARRERGRLVLLLDCLEEAHQRWGPEAASALFTRLCPVLLRYATIAYWWCTTTLGNAAFREHVRAVAQCAISFGGGRARVLKAEGRPTWSEGAVLRYEPCDGSLVFHEIPAIARLGAALHALRTERGLSQRELAALIGVTPSAVSQAERGERGLSLETVLRISDRLKVSVDALLRGERPAGYQVRRLDPADTDRVGQPLSVLEDDAAGLRIVWLRLARGKIADLTTRGGRHRVYGVAAGLCQFQLPGGSPVLRAGEVVMVETEGPVRCRNLGVSPAAVFGFHAR